MKAAAFSCKSFPQLLPTLQVFKIFAMWRSPLILKPLAPIEHDSYVNVSTDLLSQVSNSVSMLFLWAVRSGIWNLTANTLV